MTFVDVTDESFCTVGPPCGSIHIHWFDKTWRPSEIEPLA
jgi:hypothetical protein